MLNFKNILVSFLAFMLMASVTTAQVENSQSRLDIGKNANAVNISTAPLSSFIVKSNVPSEVNASSATAINDFYRNLLIKSTNSNSPIVLAANSTYTPERITADKLYIDNEISISNIYPNPANDFTIIDYQIRDSNKKSKISIINLLGGVVGEFELDAFENSLRISTRNWDNGIYFYQFLLDGKKVATKKLLVRHH